jgi:hypothetical protein
MFSFLKQISIKVLLTALAKEHVLGILCDFSAFLALSIISKMKFYLFVHLMHVFVSICCLFAICSVVTWNSGNPMRGNNKQLKQQAPVCRDFAVLSVKLTVIADIYFRWEYYTMPAPEVSCSYCADSESTQVSHYCSGVVHVYIGLLCAC